MLLLHRWLKNAQQPGKNYHQVKDWGAGRELLTSRGALLGEAGGTQCGGEVSPASSFLWAIQEGAGQSKPCFLPCIPHVLHTGNVSQATECKSGSECQCRLFMIDPFSLSFWRYLNTAGKGMLQKPRGANWLFLPRRSPFIKCGFHNNPVNNLWGKKYILLMHENHPSKQKVKSDEVNLQSVMSITLHQQGFLEEITMVRQSLHQSLLIRGRKNDSQTSRVTCLPEHRREESCYSLHCMSAPRPEAQQNNARDILGGQRFLGLFSHSLCTWNFLRKERKSLGLPVRGLLPI